MPSDRQFSVFMAVIFFGSYVCFAVTELSRPIPNVGEHFTTGIFLTFFLLVAAIFAAKAAR